MGFASRKESDRIEDPSQTPVCTLPARLLPVFDNSEKGPGGVSLYISPPQIFPLSLEKPTFRFRNQSQSTVGTIREA